VVGFETSQGSVTRSAITESGIANASLTPNGLADSRVVVTATCGGTTQTTQVIFMANVPSRVSCRALPDTVPDAMPDGSTVFSTVVATVTDAYGNAVEDGTPVVFSVTQGTGVITQDAQTSGGLATARFTPRSSGITRLKATCGGASGDVGVVVLAHLPGAVIASPDTAWIAVGDTQDRTQTVVTARVFDSSMNPVADSTGVSFSIEYGPGGGEYLDSPALGYGPVVKQTSSGKAWVTVNSGTKPGTLLMTISAGDRAATAVKIGITAGHPDSIFITTGDIVVGSDCIYVLAVGAIVRDEYNNPVENGIPVYFTLSRSDIGIINPEAVTGGLYPCAEFSATPNKGVTHACLRFPGSSMTKPYSIIARCGNLESSLSTTVPIVAPCP
jgi:hypothetical protein